MAIYEIEVLSARRTGADMRRSLRRIVEPLADVRCCELCDDDIGPIIDAIAVDAPIHAVRIRAYFSGFCSWACERGDMDENPVRIPTMPPCYSEIMPPVIPR